MFLYDFYQVPIRDVPGISEKYENWSKSTKVTKVIRGPSIYTDRDNSGLAYFKDRVIDIKVKVYVRYTGRRTAQSALQFLCENNKLTYYYSHHHL